jgi:phosphatidate cytidylyltransferase
VKNRILGTLGLLLLIGGAIGALADTGVVLLLTLFALGAQGELIRLVRRMGVEIFSRQVLFWTMVIVVGSMYLKLSNGGIYLTIIAIISVASFTILTGNPNKVTSALPSSLLAIIYIPFSFQFGTLILRHAPSLSLGMTTLAWVVLVCKLSDVGALMCGTLLGRRKLAPLLSPKKTWEGLFGGIAVACICGYWGASWFRICADPWQRILLPLLLAIVSAIADLLESALKRKANVKDSGRCIPGIGGCLDLCDSLTFALPTAYLFFLFTRWF